MKICVGLSGGVDSSVAALLLKRQGYDVFAMFMQNWHDADATLHGDCQWEEDRFVAELVARKIGIPFYFVDLSEAYRQRVVDEMFAEYAAGRTPNPDILCNREIKFDVFWQAARRLGADCVATGHYCRKETFTTPEGEQVCRILEGTDPNKDQSYFLCQLSQEQLRHALFPIGHLTKPQVREIARGADLPSADRKDSQGICFVGKVDLPTFLRQKLAPVKGPVVEVYDAFYAQDPQYAFVRETLGGLLRAGGTPLMTARFRSEDTGGRAFNNRSLQEGDRLPGNDFDPQRVAALSDAALRRLSTPFSYAAIRFETETVRSGKRRVKVTRFRENPWGKIVGEHQGAHFYTVGQRKGLGVGGHADALFILATDTASNTVYVGEGHAHKGLSRSCLHVPLAEIHWIRPDLAMSPGQMRRYRVRIRYRQPLQEAFVLMRADGLYILFDVPQRAAAPGQFAAWYDAEGEMLGSGRF